MAIRIKRSLAKRIETPYSVTYEVDLPKSSQYVGFKAIIPDYCVREREWYDEIIVPTWWGDRTFVLVKIEREPGKRYARPKLTLEQLENELREYSEQFDFSTSPKALVAFNVYEYDGSTKESQERQFAVGTLTEKWFVEDGTLQRRRRSAQTFEVIKENISDNDALLYSVKIERLAAVREQLCELISRKNQLLNEVDFWIDERAKRIELSPTLLCSLENVKKAFDDEVLKKEQEIKELYSFIGQK